MAAVALVSGLAACGNGNEAKTEVPPGETAAPTAGPIVTANYEVRGFRDAEVRADGEAYTARRTQSDPQGISILARENTRALKFDFSVSGSVERVSYYRAGTWTDLPLQTDYSLRMGPGGAFHILVVPLVGQAATATVTGVTDCTAVADGGCPMLQAP